MHYMSIQQTHKDYISAHTYMHEYTCIKTHMQYKACELHTPHVYNMHIRHVHKTYAYSTCTWDIPIHVKTDNLLMEQPTHMRSATIHELYVHIGVR